MELFKNIGRAVSEAASYLEAKNRRAARLNRIRTVIRCQQKAAEKEYLALGRYYYHNLRDQENAVTEPHCVSLDQIEQDLDKALDQLEKFYGEEEQESGREEVTLEDVTEYEQDPVSQEEAPSQACQQPKPQEPQPAPQQAEPGNENDSLPFEG